MVTPKIPGSHETMSPRVWAEQWVGFGALGAGEVVLVVGGHEPKGMRKCLTKFFLLFSSRSPERDCVCVCLV